MQVLLSNVLQVGNQACMLSDRWLVTSDSLIHVVDNRCEDCPNYAGLYGHSTTFEDGIITWRDGLVVLYKTVNDQSVQNH